MQKIKNPEVKSILEKVSTFSIPTDKKQVSYSQVSTYWKCPHQWYLTYGKKLFPYQGSIHTVFGTSLHETIQLWLQVMYNESIKKAQSLDLNQMLLDKMYENYKIELGKNNNIHFTNKEELEQFYLHGVDIIDFLKKKRSSYFSPTSSYLIGCEIPLFHEIKQPIHLKGFIDLVIYDTVADKYTIIDIKTSTRGWSDYDKKNDKKTAQLLFYKEFFSRQFNVDIDRINVEFFILKRILPENTEFLPKRLQRFAPSSGKIKTGKALSQLLDFLNEAFDSNGEIVDKEYKKVPSKFNCGFCPYRDKKELCSHGIE